MKKLLLFSWLLPVFAFIVLSPGCMKDRISKTYQIMRPVYADKAVVFDNVKSGPVEEMVKPGKIFIRGNYLFINEVNRGIHIYNNSNPSSPQPVSFISIPGNIDVASSGNYLYADIYTDMLTIDIQDPLNAKLVDTSLNVFPERNYNGWTPDNTKMIVDWVISDTTVSSGQIDNWIGGGCMGCDFFAAPQNTGAEKAVYVPGIAGSMARFAIVNDFLYAVNLSSLIVFDIHNEAEPVRKSENFIGWQIETIYPFRNNLFIGSASGMFIFNIDQPAAPEQKGSFAHARACDPVVSDGQYAFVTLRSGDDCAGNSDQLDIIDVSDIMNPYLVKTYALNNPQGLGKDGDLLFICDGEAGVKVYDATDVLDLRLVTQITNIDAFDAIPWANNLIVSAVDGLHQYDYTDRSDIKLLSTIRIAGK